MLKFRLRFIIRLLITIGDSRLVAGVFVVVAVDAQEFPIATIRGVVAVVVVLMVDRELREPFAAKFAAAFPTDPRVEF